MADHRYYTCGPGCDKPYCCYCQGGLSLCTVCRGAEGSLATECPGYPLSEAEQDDIYKAVVDFRGGKWVFVKKAGALSPDEIGSILVLALLTAIGLAVLILAGTPWGWA